MNTNLTSGQTKSTLVLQHNLYDQFEEILQAVPSHIQFRHNSPFSSLAHYLHPGEIWSIAGSSGYGKSSFILNLIYEILRANPNSSSCAWISLDDSKHLFCQRINESFNKERDWLKQVCFLDELDHSHKGLNQLCSQLVGDQCFIVLDYLQQIAMGQDSPRIEIDQFLLNAKRIINTYKKQQKDITFVLISQTTSLESNPAKNSKGSTMTTPLRLKESEGIFQQSNLVMSIRSFTRNERNNEITLLIDKNKSGKAGDKMLYEIDGYKISNKANTLSPATLGMTFTQPKSVQEDAECNTVKY